MRLIAPALLSAALAATETPPMGYAQLGPDGRPQGVVVAVTRAALARLDPASGIQMALGLQDLALSYDGATITGTLELPIAVPGTAWQELVLPVPGTITSISARPLGAQPPGRIQWYGDDAGLHISHEGGRQSLLVITFAIAAVTPKASICLRPGLGGRLRLYGRAPWRPAGGIFDRDLPLDVNLVEAAWEQPAAAPAAQRLSLEQTVRLAMQPGRLEWKAELVIRSAGTPISAATVRLPDGLRLVEGGRQEGDRAELTFPVPSGEQPVTLVGIIPRSHQGRCSPLVSLPGAATSRGRLGLVAATGERFVRPDHAALRPDAPAPDEALATRWDEQPEGLAIAWEAQPSELAVARDLAVACDAGTARATARISISGRGTTGGLRLSLPAPWRLAGVAGAAGAVQDGILHLVRSDPWSGGASATVQLEADPRLLGDHPPAPTLEPVGVAAGRLRLAVADGGDRRLTLAAPEARPLPPDALGLPLAPGLRWRSAAELAPGQQAGLRLGREALRTEAVLSHYVILGRDGARWSLHLAATPEAGALESLGLRLPDGARLISVSGPGLGAWSRSDGRLDLRWAAPTTGAIALDLELDLPAAADGSLRLTAPAIDGLRSVQQLALVEEDDLGLVRRDPDGLSELPEPVAALPAGVDRRLVRWLWRSARADWSLGLSREPLAATAGADGVATLVDGAASLAPDGELRGTAVWHVVNRTRQQLPLQIPAGSELWEARVDQQPVRARRDADGSWWLPVPPLRPGQAGTRVALAWRQAAGAHPRLAPPVLGGLKVVSSVWRLSAPDGHRLRRTGGPLDEAEAADAAATRAQAVVDEIQRLQSVDTLNEAGLKRLDAQLAQLDAELKDHLAVLDRPVPGADRASSFSSARKSVADNRAVVQELQQQVSGKFGQRSAGRSKLNLDSLRQSWEAPAQRPDATPTAWPWETAVTPGPSAGLGAGQAAPGTNAATTALAGIDLAPEPTRIDLVLRGQGPAMEAALALEPVARGRAAWFWLCAAAALAVAGWRLRRRSP